MTRPIYNDEGRVIGEEVDGRIYWYYSDGEAGGENGGYYMSTYEFLRYNGLLQAYNGVSCAKWYKLPHRTRNAPTNKMNDKEQRVKTLAEKIFRELYGEYGWGETSAWNEAYKLANKIVYQ